MPLPRFRLRTLMIAVAVVGISVSLYGWLTVEVPPRELLMAAALGHDTEYAAGFRERDLAKIRVGMSHQEVLAVLGQPLERRDFARSRPEDGAQTAWVDEMWYYSRSRSGARGVGRPGNFWNRAIFFDRGKVSRVYREFHRR